MVTVYYQFSVITLASSEVRRYDLNNGHFKSQKCPLFESCLFAQNTLEGLFHNWGQDTKLFHPLIFLRHFYAALIIHEFLSSQLVGLLRISTLHDTFVSFFQSFTLFLLVEFSHTATFIPL